VDTSKSGDTTVTIISPWILYKDGDFTFAADSGIIASIDTPDPANPHQVEILFGDDGEDDCPLIGFYTTVVVKLAEGIDWGWGPQFQIGGNTVLNESSWADVAEWSGGKTTSGGGTGGDLSIASVLEIILE